MPPLIALFHGGGSSAYIMNVQCARLENALSKDFKFVYFDAPFKSPAGPGVLPAFRDQGPFRSWFKFLDGGFEGGIKDKMAEDGSGLERVKELMAAHAPLSEWVGALGFSQGTRVVGGLLLEQQRALASGAVPQLQLSFGVLCMGGSAPMKPTVAPTLTDGNTNNSQNPADEDALERISIPTLHLHGLRDPYVGMSRRQLDTFYDSSKTTLYEINYHHAMPWEQSEIDQFAELMRQIYEDARRGIC
ncbi:MAG: hypothetical protein LQ342_005964 [Letrouitia transgressa]|nr:MAG: hypothetical protein LQ342_005964 [Letrouitia transgressa]